MFRTADVCGAAFLLCLALACLARSYFKWIPRAKAAEAYQIADITRVFSTLQYQQADSDDARRALLAYADLLRRDRIQRIQIPEANLQSQLVFTYLRLYRIEAQAGRTTEAEHDLEIARTELAAAGSRVTNFDANKRLEQILTDLDKEDSEQKARTKPVPVSTEVQASSKDPLP